MSTAQDVLDTLTEYKRDASMAVAAVKALCISRVEPPLEEIADAIPDEELEEGGENAAEEGANAV